MEDRPRVVAVCGPSSAAVNAAWRAALVARDLGAPLHVLHPAAQSPALVRELTDDLTQRTRVETVVEAVAGDVWHRAVAASRQAALLVIAGTGARRPREWFTGTPAERMVRLCGSPVLVVRRPALVPYRRVLVPVDLDGHAQRLVALASSLSQGTRTDVLHVLDAADEKVLRGMSDSQQALRSFRQHRAQGAYLAIHQLMGAADPGDAGVEAGIAFGDVPAVALARAGECDAELVVVGKRRRGLLAHHFLRGTTQRILARADCDVLVQPVHGRQAVEAAPPFPVSRRKLRALPR